MASVNVDLPDDFVEKMKVYPDIDWDSVLNEVLRHYLSTLEVEKIQKINDKKDDQSIELDDESELAELIELIPKKEYKVKIKVSKMEKLKPNLI